MKKLLLFFGLALFMMLNGSLVSAGDVSGCSVSMTGFHPGLKSDTLNRSGYTLFLVCPGQFARTMFYLSADLGKEGLAIALAASSTGQTVMARIGSATAPNTAGSIVTVLYLE